jgi:hypothetical protein
MDATISSACNQDGRGLEEVLDVIPQVTGQPVNRRGRSCEIL